MLPLQYEYIWLDASGSFRSKTRIVRMEETDKNMIEQGIYPLPTLWNFDGSSTGQATTERSECWLKPVHFCHNPFVADKRGYLVLCSVYQDYECTRPAAGNWRHDCEALWTGAVVEQRPWFGFEQEYIIESDDTRGELRRCIREEGQGAYYCAVGTGRALHRELPEEHMKMCLDAGIDYYGMNAEVAPGQWEFQLGPTGGIASADQLLLARYILIRIAETHDVTINFHPKPLEGVNGSGCHTNVSTVDTRDCRDGRGVSAIEDIIHRLATTHELDIQHYGEDNEKRLSGNYETSDIRTFSWGVGSRDTSVRIGNQVMREGGGYFEDRRPAANINPYRVLSVLFRAIRDANRI